MRNTAYCLGTSASEMYAAGCDGVYGYDQIGACAWRISLIAIHGAKDTDTANLKRECRLPPEQMGAAMTRADEILLKITRRKHDLSRIPAP